MPTDDLRLWAGAALFAAMGVGALARPDLVLGQFGLRNLSAAARSEVRAVYGGFGLAMAALLLFAARTPPLREGVATTLAVALFGMAAGRVVSAIADRRIDAAPLAWLAVELAAGALLLGAR